MIVYIEPKDADDDPSQYTKRLFFINSTIIEREKAIYDKKCKKSKNDVGSIPVNDFYDCTCMIDVMIRESGAELLERPDPQESIDALEAVKRFSSSNRG